MSQASAKKNYALKPTVRVRTCAPPRLPYRPRLPRRYRPGIGLIGCGGITRSHLDAYRAAGWKVVALCDTRREAATERRDAFFPQADLYTDYRALLERPDIEVVDVALHPEPRAAAVEAALRAGKHVLSQKPFALDLGVGERLVALADQQGRRLAVNQNGRWAPYVHYGYQAIRTGLIGELQTVSITLNWDHTWIRGTAFEQVQHVVLYDFAIHWFDMVAWFFAGRRAQRVFAANASATEQQITPPLIGSALIEFEGGTAVLHFDAHSRFGAQELLCATGSAGTWRAHGPICAAHNLTLFTRRGVAQPRLEGKWFNDGFRGAMGELLCAIEEDREPLNSARENLHSLALCFAAVKAADTGRVQTPGAVRRIAP